MSSETSELNRIYPNTIILSTLSFSSVVLCIPPLIWHFSQRNIPAWSLILWITVINIYNAVNPLIWQNDNIDEWWNGNIYCDIQVRVLVGSVAALPACITMIMRKLARVMDTRNITIAPSRSSKRKEMVLEVLWCWGYPLILILAYYIVQPNRYYIYTSSGCGVSFDASWPSAALNWIWTPITMFFASCKFQIRRVISSK